MASAETTANANTADKAANVAAQAAHIVTEKTPEPAAPKKAGTPRAESKTAKILELIGRAGSHAFRDHEGHRLAAAQRSGLHLRRWTNRVYKIVT